MHRFTLIHDGSNQAWQAAYLAFHVAARLGAPLLAILIDSSTNKNINAQRAAQIGVGGRAAKVTTTIHHAREFSIDALEAVLDITDGLFLPRNLILNNETSKRLLENLTYPVWIVTRKAGTYPMVALVNDLARDAALISYTTSLSERMQQSLDGLVRESEHERVIAVNPAVHWIPLSDFTPGTISTVIDQLRAGLFFIPASNLDLVHDLNINFVVFPGS